MKDKDDFCLQGTLRTFLLLNLINKKSITPEKYCKSISFRIKLGEKEFLLRRFKLSNNYPHSITIRHDGRPKVTVQLRNYHVCNLIAGSDRLLCNEWFDGIRDFHEGFAAVFRRREDSIYVHELFEHNWIDLNGKLLRSTWCAQAGTFQNGLAKFKDKTSGLWNFIRRDGSLLNPIGGGYNVAYDFQKEGYATVSKDGKWNLVNKDGNFFSPTWYLSFKPFKYGFAVVQRVEDGRYNWIRMDGSLLSQGWYDKCIDFYEVDNKLISICELNGSFSFIDANGNLNEKIKDLL